MDTMDLYQKFTQLVFNYKERIKESKRARKEVAKNPTANDPHIKWLGESASKILTQLKVIGREYNENNPDKAFTNQDMLDILETAILAIKR